MRDIEEIVPRAQLHKTLALFITVQILAVGFSLESGCFLITVHTLITSHEPFIGYSPLSSSCLLCLLLKVCLFQSQERAFLGKLSVITWNHAKDFMDFISLLSHVLFYLDKPSYSSFHTLCVYSVLSVICLKIKEAKSYSTCVVKVQPKYEI